MSQCQNLGEGTHVYKCTLQKKLADLTKFRHPDGMFMDLTVLANFSLSEITLAELKVLSTFCQFRTSKIISSDTVLTYLRVNNFYFQIFLFKAHSGMPLFLGVRETNYNP